MKRLISTALFAFLSSAVSLADDVPQLGPAGAAKDSALSLTENGNAMTGAVDSVHETQGQLMIEFRPASRGAPSARIGGATRSAILYRPPKTGAPDARVGGGTRGNVFTPKATKGAPSARIGGGTRQGFVPPSDRGAPNTRIGGGTREEQLLDSFTLSVIAPEEIGLTVQEQPVLFWYLSDSIDEPVEFTLIDATSIEAGVKPLLELRMDAPVQAGFHAVALADYGFRLSDHVDYQWFITIVHDELQRSADTLAGAQIRKVALETDLGAQLSGEDGNKAIAYAAGGIWYDAIEELEAEIQSGGDAVYRKQKVQLLQQVGLSEAAAAVDMGAATE